MTPSARLRVEVGGQTVGQGTAFLCDGYVVTAFHVVGTCESGAWRHDLQEGVRYSLQLGHEVELSPVIADSEADLALLRSTSDASMGSPALLSSSNDIVGREWRAVGFPPSVDDNEYAVDGTVTHIREWWDAKGLQLYARQGTNVVWEGISGSPVVVDHHVVGVLTAYTPLTATLWASTGGALRRLISLANSSLPAEIDALLAANRTGFDTLAPPGRGLVRTISFPNLIKLLDGIESQPAADGVRKALTRLASECGPPPARPSNVILLPRNRWTSPPTPDLLTPSGSGNRGDLRVLFGEATGDEFASLSERAIRAIETGDFEGYIDIGASILRKSNEVGSAGISHDGASLVADGYRLLAGMRPSDETDFLRIAAKGFGEVLDRSPTNVRALRGRACCAQADHNYGDALRAYGAAIEATQDHLASQAGALQPLSRRLGERHELLRLLRHRTEVIVLIRRTSAQSAWNSEKGRLQLEQYVEAHVRLFNNMMPEMAAHADWHDFESFASQVFLAAALHDLGYLNKSADAALDALRHRRTMVRGDQLTGIQRSNFRWWSRVSRASLMASSALAGKFDTLERALSVGQDGSVLESVDSILATEGAGA